MNSPEIISVAELTRSIKQKLETSFSSIAVRGEVSNLRQQASGHIYFTLKDKEAQISAVLFRGNAMRLKQLPKDGDQIVVNGELSVYPPRGNYQMIIRTIEFSGVGPLLKRLHELKLKLKTQGLFDPGLKKPLPKFPKTIGVVTSPTGSVIQDILNVLTRRFHGFHLILNPVRVQGAGAAEEIARAIEECNQYYLCDVLIIGRGGGSLEDLWPFNEEIVAHAIHKSNIPIISAVGHETDITIADFVADVRAPTPSAAAEIVTGEKNAHLQHLQKTQTRILQSIQGHLRTYRRMLETIEKQPPLSSPYSLLGNYLQKIDDFRESSDSRIKQILHHHRRLLSGKVQQKEALKPSVQISILKQNFTKQKNAVLQATLHQISFKRQKLTQLTGHLRSIDPRNLLKKGYSILFHEKNDSVILSMKDVQPEDNLRVKLSDGQILVQVKEM